MIRMYRQEDLNAVVDIWYEAVKQTYHFLPENLLASQKNDVINIYLPRAETWVAEENDQIIGFISVYENVVRALFVRPEHQNGGVGTRLIERVRAIKGIVSLEVFKENVRALKFYEKCGFVPTKEGLCSQTGLPTFVGQLKSRAEKDALEEALLEE